MVEIVQEDECYLFEDDLKVYKEMSSDGEAYELQKKTEWTQCCLLKFNP